MADARAEENWGGFGKHQRVEERADDENEVEIDDTTTRSGRQDLLRRKRLNTLFLGLAFTCLGIMYAILGPVFLDLLHIVQVNIETGSIIFTSASIGYLTGSLLCGFMLEKVNHDLLLFVSTFGMGLLYILQPWIPVLAGLAVVQAVALFCAGALDTALNTVCMLIWGVKAGPYMQAVHFLFAIGGLLAPLIAEPFLMKNSNASTTTIAKNISNFFNNSTQGRRDYHQSSSVNLTFSTQTETRVHNAFLIAGLIVIVTSFTFIYMYFINKRQTKLYVNPQEDRDENLKLTLSSKIVYLVLLALFFLFYTSVEDTIMCFLATFVVEYAKWSNSDGANVVAVYWGSYAGARLLSVFVAKVLSPWKMLLLDFMFLLISLIFLCLLAHIPTILWISSAFVGLSIASIFPTAFAWTQNDIMKVDGRIASLFLISGGVGTVANPLILGYLFEHHTPMWFVWLLLGECMLNILIFIVIIILTNYQYGRVFAIKSGHVVDEILLETDRNT